MNYAQAQEVFNEIIRALEYTKLDSYSLLEVKSADKEPESYSIHIKAFLGTARKQEIMAIVQKYGLNVSDGLQNLVLS